MDANDKKDLDRILSVLYKNSPVAWYKIYTDLKIDKARAEQLFKIGFAFDYLQIEHKGMGEYPTDNHYVGITNVGIRFFALANFSGTEKTIEQIETPTRFNTYIGGSNGGFNVLDINQEQLQIIIEAYLSGKPDFTIAGQTYHPKKYDSIKIFGNSSGHSKRELKNIGLANGSEKGFNGRFFSEEDLEEFGEDLTYSLIGNAQSGSRIQQAGKAGPQEDKLGHKADVKDPHIEAETDKPIFISYSWDSREHEDHVLSFAEELRNEGFNVDIDKILSQRKTATNFNQMMLEAFANSEFIIIVLSSSYKTKADKFEGGVGIEYRIIVGEIDRFPKKYILVSFSGRDETIVPVGLAGRDIIDISAKGLEPLFRKLTDQPEFVLSPVSKLKPKLGVRSIPSFSEHQKKLKAKTPQAADNSELLSKRIEKKNKLKRDFAAWLNYKKEDVKKRFRMIIHSAENDTYPDQPMLENVPSTWFAAEIHGASHHGMEFCNENSVIYVNAKNKWSSVKIDGFDAVNVSVIKTIFYDDIIAWDMDGNYNCPHFYANFTNGMPWKNIYYVSFNKPHMTFDKSNHID